MKILINFELDLNDLQDWMDRQLTDEEISKLYHWAANDLPTKAFYDLREVAREFSDD